MFQSTHSLRSATPASSSIRQSGSVSIHALLAECDLLGHTRSHLESCFNPRTPCGVRHGGSVRNARTPPVSIHALLAECDPSRITAYQIGCVSIHALLAECDSGGRGTWSCTSSFNPRTPCGVRRYVPISLESV